jgi:hypothetical protein
MVRDSDSTLQLIRATGLIPHLYPHLLILLPSPCTRGEGLGGFALCFDGEFNVYLRFRSVNK